jgi:hypothetical protein
MSVGERIDPKSGPFGNFNQAYVNNLDSAAKGFEPVLRGMALWNLEVLGLMTRRARAWAEIPSRLSQCKTPQDVVREQMQFWQAAAHDYTDGAQRLSVAFGGLAVPGLNGAHAGKDVAPERDYITFPEPKPAADHQPQRSRKAAAA